MIRGEIGNYSASTDNLTISPGSDAQGMLHVYPESESVMDKCTPREDIYILPLVSQMELTEERLDNLHQLIKSITNINIHKLHLMRQADHQSLRH